MIQITNHGPLIVSTNYWQSEYASARKIFCSVNAGAIRVLLPPTLYGMLAEMRTGKYCVLSRGPWWQAMTREAVEIMWEDGSDSPFALHLNAESFDMLPAEPEPGRDWVCSVWTNKDGRPHRSLERPCHWRRAPKIPWMKPWAK
jgi:hypothetical protein